MARLTVDMDTIDLRNAGDVVVRGRHVDNLQGLLKATRVPHWDPGPGQMAVQVFFTCAQDGDESPPVALSRVVPESPAVLRAALDQLLAGPDQAERAAGFSSWFSSATAGLVNTVALEPSGRAIVDFGDLRPIIPGASSSAGSRLLLSQLDATVFQFPPVRSVQYRLNGSCDVFFEWLQAACHDRPRSGGPT